MIKELEALKIICEQSHDINLDQHKEIVKTALERLNKFQTIIKTKEPRISMIKSMIRCNCVDYAKYNQAVYDYEQLKEEDFNIVVEELK